MRLSIYATMFFLSLINVFGQTQQKLNSEAKLEFEKVDKELNRVYSKLLADYKVDTVFIKALREAQRQWLKFRDAQVKMKFPPRNSNESVLPMCRNYYLSELTNNRIKELNQWVEGIDEGDVCFGSIKVKQ
jgi:uncharacterized protein YecT (DUF1311 family)